MAKSDLQSSTSLIAEIATLRISEIDTATLIELSIELGTDLEGAIATLESRERKRLRGIPRDKLWEILTDA